MAHSSRPRSSSLALQVFFGEIALILLVGCQDSSPGLPLAGGVATTPLGASASTLLDPIRSPVVQAPLFEVQDSSRPTFRGATLDQQDPLSRTTEEELLLRSARNALTLGNTGEALKFFDSYLLLRPEDVAVRIEYAGLLVGQGQLSLSKEMYGEALVVRPSDVDLLRSLADVLIMSGEYATATRHLESVLSQEPDDLATAAILCRSYTWIRDFESADEVFDRYLRKLDPMIEADQLLLAPVLLDMQRPKEALPYLERLHRRFPQELRWATHMVLCYYLSGKRDRADRMVKTMADLEPDSVELRIRLADQLLSLQNYKLAMDVNEQVLRAAPEDPLARLMSARIHLEAYDVAGARALLDELRDELFGVRSYQLAQAKLHQLTGEWVVAQSILDMMLIESPSDHDIRIRLASLLIEKGDIYRAIAELSKIPSDSPLGPRARLELASAKVVQGRTDEAVSVCTALVGERPNDVEATLGLLRAQIEMKATVQAKYVAQRFIEQCPSDAMGIGQVRLMLARALSLEGNNFQAVRIYEQALLEPTAQTPAAFYGLAEAKRRGVSEASSELALLSSTLRASGEDVRLRIEFGKLALNDQDHSRAIAFFEGVLRWQPNNVAALVLLGEAQNLALKSGADADPLQTFARVLSRNPENTRARLGLARALVVKRRYAEAISEYENVVAQDATYTFAQREYARALYWDHQEDEAFAVYEELLANLPTEAMVIDIFGQAGPADVLGAELDFRAQLELSEAVRLEREAKSKMNWEPELAMRALKQLLVLEPANQEARFDLAQLYHRRGRTQDAIDEYEDLIDLSNGHGEAAKVMKGAEREMALRFTLDVGSEKLVGADRLAYITQDWSLADVTFPVGDRDDFFGLGYGHRRYDGSEPSQQNQHAPTVFDADVLRLFASSRITDTTVIDGLVEYPNYDPTPVGGVGMKSRPYFNMGLRHMTTGELEIALRLFNEPLIQNRVTLQRDIYRVGARLGVSNAATQELDYGLSALFADYSDEEGNSQVSANAFMAYEFNPAPTEFRLMLKADFDNFAHENDPLTGNNFQGLDQMDTPYFSPRAYSIYTLRADWKHQFGDDWFTGAKDMYYNASLSGSIDSNSVGYMEFIVGGSYDFTDWLGFRAGMRLLRSSAIEATTANAVLTLRWP
jgi:tetratricopeptide (TPR) repeat protein